MAKGITIDEKRKRLLDLFYDSKDFFVFKEVEKIASKKKGIVVQSVKDVLQSLVDDDLVRQEKIGTSNYFWSFPSQKVVLRTCAVEKAAAERAALVAKVAAARVRASDEQRARTGADRPALIAEYERLARDVADIDATLKKYSACDPETFAEKKRSAAALKSDVNKVTDDLFAIKSYVTAKFGVEQKDFCDSFGVDEGLDYVEC